MMKTVHLYAGVIAAVAVGTACRSQEDLARPPQDGVAGSVVEVASIEDTRPIILFVGTSLTAGYGLDPTEAYPALLQTKIDSAGFDYQVVNAAVSGQTSAGALTGLDWLLRRPAAVLVVETGGNDGLRGIDPAELEANLEAIILRAREQVPQPRIVLTGMEAPPNLGVGYTGRFRAVYGDLARKYDLAFVPFLLEGVAGVDSLNQADGIHPTPAGQRIMAEYVWHALQQVLTERI